MIGWLDCAAGASGDMFLGALVDVGVPLEYLQSTVDGLGVERTPLRAEPVTRHGLGATKVTVEAPTRQPHHRTWRDVRGIIERAGLDAPVAESALAAFGYLARAEAAVHRMPAEDVHFHEVGALDAIADIVGACAGLHWLAVHRGLDQLFASTVTVGEGTTRGAHGSIPVPAPAVLGILAEAKAPVRGGLPYEACTPTGAALLAAHVDHFGSLPTMQVTAVGMGAGGRDPEHTANVLRLILGEPAGAPSPAPEAAVMLAANVDDLDPRLWPVVLEELFRAGASDAWLSPIVMKKGRPAHTLQVLCPESAAATVRAAIFRHTSTIGIRRSAVDKYPLAREMSTVDVRGQSIRVKIARQAGRVVNVSVEYEDVVAAAANLGLPAKILLAQATAAAQHHYETP